MKVGFFFECGEINEIGTGHKYRCKTISNALVKRGHIARFIDDIDNQSDIDVLIVDHMVTPKKIISKSKECGKKVVLIDGDDVENVDLSISVVCNPKAKYRGLDYLIFPKFQHTAKYCEQMENNNTVFVGMGGFDKNNYVDLVVEILSDLGMYGVIAERINKGRAEEKLAYDPNCGPNLYMYFWHDDNYFKAMQNCVLAITNGGLTMFQALHYGIPTIPIAQYEHQKSNIDLVKDFCFPSEPNRDDIVKNINFVLSNSNLRNSYSSVSRSIIDGSGVDRVCDLIEELL